MLIRSDDLLSGKHGRSGHFVRFYDDGDVMLDEVATFLGQAVRTDGKGIVIATQDHIDVLRRRLGPAAVRVSWVDADAALAQFMVDGWPDPARFEAAVGTAVAAACAGGATVHAFGEMVALLCARGCHDAALELEALWNELAQQHVFSLFCAYPWDAFPTPDLAQAFRQVCAQHDHACADTALVLPAEGDADIGRLRLEQEVRALRAEVARYKDNEQALRRSERELADFVENAVEGLHRVGADGTILWANRAELQMLGYGWEEYVGRNITEFHADRPAIDDIIARLGRGETLYDHPARLRCKDGSIKHVLIHSNASFEDGRLRYTRCFTRDATERRERDIALEQRDRMLLDAPVAAALLMGPDFVVRLANRCYRELAGRDVIEGQPLLQAFPELRGSEIHHLLDQAHGNGRAARAEELRVLLRDAAGRERERFLKFSVEPLAVEEGEERGMVVVAVDVTEHVRTRQEIEQAHAERAELLAELTAASRAKDEFLAMLGHELRNPLSPIVSALELIRMRGETGSVREREIIERQVQHLVRLVDDLLDVSRVTRGKVELKCERVELAQPLGKAVEMARPLLEQHHHRLDVEIEPGLAWEGDPMRLAQVVSNLLTNAARYTPAGGHVVLRARGEDDARVRIDVRDTGIGMSPELRTQVFDLFFQGKRDIDRAEGGLGIGLALVKNIVELHGGRVEAHSAGPGMGSEFVVLLPRRTPAASAAPDGPRLLPAPAAKRRRVMLVDDNVDGADTLARLLAAHGHEVKVFNEPVAALAAVPGFLPDLAVLDIGLPVLDGYEVARRLRPLLDGHPCRLVALTGYGLAADRARSAAAGFDAHLVKPVNPDLVVRLAGGSGTV
ncbi:ATP-binding protein [Massilia sp. Root335]|uniref:ATP-binding protein n=1 Tax=Massilia sp. Root335 TaxID=1736517 RepID=UPI001E34C4F8|nr:ATP-binding protein [Massilia sp. Root335]